MSNNISSISSDLADLTEDVGDFSDGVNSSINTINENINGINLNIIAMNNLINNISSSVNTMDQTISGINYDLSYFQTSYYASSASQMVDTNKIYIYTGYESGYKKGHLYYYDADRSAWIDMICIDDTLALQGYSADAKKTGDEISNINNKIENIKSSIDGRNNDFENHLTTIENNLYSYENGIVTWTLGSLDLETGSNQTANNRVVTNMVSIDPASTLKIYMENGFMYKIFYYASSSQDSFTYCDDFWSKGTRSITNESDNSYYIKIIAGYNDDAYISNVTSFVSNISIMIGAKKDFALKSDVEEIITISSQYTNSSCWSIENDKVIRKTLSESTCVSFDPIYVQQGQKYIITASQGNVNETRIWIVADLQMNVISIANSHYNAIHTEEVIIPQGGAFILVSSYNYADALIRKSFTALGYIKEKLLSNKTVAIIGDSISTNGISGTDSNAAEITIAEEDVGAQLSAYLTYYDVAAGLSIGNHAFTEDEIGTDVTFTPNIFDVGKVIGRPNNYNDNSVTTWWEVAQSELGFNTIPVCWSGASMSSHRNDQQNMNASYAWHPAQIRKCGIRIPGTMNRTAPDIIIIYRGTNDFSYQPYTKLTSGYFNASNWQYPQNDIVNNGYGYLEALSLTIKELRAAYPTSYIMLCTLNVFKRVNYSHFPTNNGLNTLPEYNNAIREAANFFGCGLIEFDKDGITFENCYSEGYITDSSTTPTNPSDKGHYLMGKKAIADIKTQYPFA